MRIIIAAVVSILLAGVYIDEIHGTEALFSVGLARDPSMGKLYLIIFLGIYLISEGIWQIERRRAERVAKQRAEQTEARSEGWRHEVGALRKQLTDANEQLSRLITEKKRSDERGERIQTALNAAEHELSRCRTADSSVETAVNAQLIHFLSLLQIKGRLLDFLMDDITPHDDKRIGSVARIVHHGCHAVLKDFFELMPAYGGPEGERLRLGNDFDSGLYRLIGRTADKPPYNGIVAHRGWQANSVKLPRLSEDMLQAQPPYLVAPVEIELD